MPAARRASSSSGQTRACASTYSSIFSGRTRRTNALRCVTSRPLVRALDRRGAALAREPLGVAARAEGGNRVLRQALPLPQPREQRTDVALEGLEQEPVGAEDVALGLRGRN